MGLSCAIVSSLGRDRFILLARLFHPSMRSVARPFHPWLSRPTGCLFHRHSVSAGRVVFPATPRVTREALAESWLRGQDSRITAHRGAIGGRKSAYRHRLLLFVFVVILLKMVYSLLKQAFGAGPRLVSLCLDPSSTEPGRPHLERTRTRRSTRPLLGRPS